MVANGFETRALVPTMTIYVLCFYDIIDFYQHARWCRKTKSVSCAVQFLYVLSMSARSVWFWNLSLNFFFCKVGVKYTKQKWFYLDYLIMMSSSYMMCFFFFTCNDKDGRIICPKCLQWILNPVWSDMNIPLPRFF